MCTANLWFAYVPNFVGWLDFAGPWPENWPILQSDRAKTLETAQQNLLNAESHKVRGTGHSLLVAKDPMQTSRKVRPKALLSYLFLVLFAAAVLDQLLVISHMLPRIRDAGNNELLHSSFAELREREGIPGLLGPGTRGLEHDYPEQSRLPLSEFPQLLRQLLILVEDPSFYSHPGIEFRAIRRALEINASRGELVYGGSTITQQLSRNLALSPERSLRRKYYELIAALYLEAIFTKDEILELYLNIVELGPGIYGFAAAARHFYDRRVSDLNPEQIIRLLSLMPAPLATSPDKLKDVPVLQARYHYLRQIWIQAR